MILQKWNFQDNEFYKGILNDEIVNQKQTNYQDKSLH